MLVKGATCVNQQQWFPAILANLNENFWATLVDTIIDFMFNSLWRGDAIWRHRSGWTLVQLMACCFMAPSHCLNQCWLNISGTCDIHHKAMFIWITVTKDINPQVVFQPHHPGILNCSNKNLLYTDIRIIYWITRSHTYPCGFSARPVNQLSGNC